MSQRFAVVYEADADFTVATELADRVLVESIDWLEHEMLSDQREWVRSVAGGSHFTWTGIPKLARNANIRIRGGHFDGEPGEPDAAAARRAILYLKTLTDIKAILLIRDQDDQPERKEGLEQARKNAQSGIRIIIGLAIVERESWVVCGFEPSYQEEENRLRDEVQYVGFDPRHKSHELRACKRESAKTSPKRVLRELIGKNWARERMCWFETSLEELRKRGINNGLAEYLKEVRERLAPLIGHVPNA